MMPAQMATKNKNTNKIRVITLFLILINQPIYQQGRTRFALAVSERAQANGNQRQGPNPPIF